MFLTAAQVTERNNRRESLTDLQSKATAAARNGLFGDTWSDANREDLAAELVAQILATMPSTARRGRPSDVLAYLAAVDTAADLAADPGRTGRPSDVLAYVAAGLDAGSDVEAYRVRRLHTGMAGLEDLPAIRRAMVPGGHTTADTVPASHATYTRLAMLAANWRRSVEASRRRDADALAAADPDTGSAVDMEAGHTTADALAGDWLRDPYTAAHTAARDLLAALGLPRLGKAYPAALEAVLTAHGWTLTEAAAALGCRDTDALRLKRFRALKAIPSATTHTVADHADALAMPDTAVEHPHVAALATTVRDWLPEDEHAPITTTHVAPSAVSAAPDWVRTLHPATVRRFEAIVAAKRARAAAAARDAEAGDLAAAAV